MRCEQAVEIIPDYIERSVSEALAVALEHHLRECVACTREVESLREVYVMFHALPTLDPPHGFRARLLQRLEEERRSEVGWRQRIFARTGPARTWLNLAGVAVLAVGLLALLPGGHFPGVIGQDLSPRGVVHSLRALLHPRPATDTQAFLGRPDFYVSGPGTLRPQINRELTVTLNLTPRTDLHDGGLTLYRPAGVLSSTQGVPTDDNGRRIWQGDVDADDCVQIPLHLTAIKPGVHRIVLHLTDSDRNERRRLYLPTNPAKPVQAAAVMAGSYSTDQALAGISRHFGVIIASDLVQARPRPLVLNLTTPGRTLAQFCSDRGLQWEFSDGVYNIYRLPLGQPSL